MSSRLVTVTVNGERRQGIVEDRTLLVDFIRHELKLTGTHVGCEHGVCGACTVELNGELVRSCLVFAVQADQSVLGTVEGMATSVASLHPLQKAFREHHALQCAFCTSGFLLTAKALLSAIPIRASTRSARNSPGTSAVAPGMRASSRPFRARRWR